MKEKRLIMKKITAAMAIGLAGLGLFTAADTVNASSYTSLSVGATKYVTKNIRYRIKVKTPGRLTVNSPAKVTLKNNVTWNWTLVPYSTKSKNSKVYYIRKGTYYLTTKQNSKIKTQFKKLAKYKVQNYSSKNATEIKLGKTVTGTYGFNAGYNTSNYYRFTLDSPQMVTMTYTNMPIYYVQKGNINSKADINIFADAPTTMLSPNDFRINGNKTASQSWYLAKGSYYFSTNNSMGRYSFKLTATPDTRVVPRDTEIESLKNTDDGVVATLKEALHAKTYELAWHEKGSTSADRSAVSHTTTVSTAPTTLDRELNGHKIPVSIGQKLVNGQTYTFMARGVSNPDYIRYGNPETGNYFGAWSKAVDHTYYAATTATPGAVELTAKADDTYHNIHVSWDKIKTAQSYRVAYREKGTSRWYYEVTDQAQNAITGIARNKNYEVKLQALNGQQSGPWSKIQTIFLK